MTGHECLNEYRSCVPIPKFVSFAAGAYIVTHTCGRLLDLFGIETKTVKRWRGGPEEVE